MRFLNSNNGHEKTTFLGLSMINHRERNITEVLRWE